MTLTPANQTNLYGLSNNFNIFKDLYNKKNLPYQLLLSGQKGSGKCTLAYHLINYILSIDESNPYDYENFKISEENKSYKLIQNNTHPNFQLIDIPHEKKRIDINQIRNLIQNLRKSSFNQKPRFILIDNIEYLNISSINALLKILEEPSENIFFILINNDKKILPTLKSRCLNFRISLSNDDKKKICNHIFDDNILNLFDESFLDHYFTPGKIYQLFKFAKEYEINLMKNNLKKFLSKIIEGRYYKKDIFINDILKDLIELYLIKNFSICSFDFFSYFIKKFDNIKKFNLDEESLFLEFKSKLLDG